MKYGELTMGQIEAVVNKLGGMEGVKRLLSGELVGVEKAECKFDIWKTVKLGTGLKAAEDFRRTLRDGGFLISDWASNTLNHPAFKAANEETEIDLVKVTVAELGFKKAARCQIYERAQYLGLDLCPPEVGPQLRLQYRNQPNDELIFVAMELILVSGEWSLFTVWHHDSNLSLMSYSYNPRSFLHDDASYANDLWVFVRPRNRK